MTTKVEFDLPINALLYSGAGDPLIHLGGGKFVAPDGVQIIEGSVPVGSEEKWPAQFHVSEPESFQHERCARRVTFSDMPE